MAQRKRTETSFEDSLQKLEAIVKRLEEEEIPLESSLKLFAEGQTLARACEEQLKAAENQIRQLMEKSSGEIAETDFADASGDAGAPASKTGKTESDEDEDDDQDEAEEDGSSAAGRQDLDDIRF